jgi:hypothetical protein
LQRLATSLSHASDEAKATTRGAQHSHPERATQAGIQRAEDLETPIRAAATNISHGDAAARERPRDSCVSSIESA